MDNSDGVGFLAVELYRSWQGIPLGVVHRDEAVASYNHRLLGGTFL
jgi:hypothetical protein